MQKHCRLFQIFVFVLLILGPARAQWETQDSGVTVTLRDVCFVDSLHGWAVGDSATIIATADGGETWIPQESPVKNISLQKVKFFNKKIGFIIGDNEDQVSIPKGFILFTNDSGRSWQVSKGDINYLLEDFSFINADTGWVVGQAQDPRHNGILLYTENGGQTWVVQLQTEKNELLVAVDFLDGRNGWLLGGPFFDPSAVHVYRTETGGRQWEIISEIEVPVDQIRVASQDTLWAALLGFARSDDGGLNWFEKSWTAYFVSGIFDIEPINGQQGWLVASYLKDSNSFASRILFTRNGGQNWETILEGQSPTLRALAFGGNRLWAVGAFGVVLRSSIVTTSTRKLQNQSPDGFFLDQNYPNPFNTSTVIRFTLNQTDFITLTVYSILGRKVAVLLARTVTTGSHSVKWDGKNSKGELVSSGIYLYELRSSMGIDRKKMIILR